LNEEQLKSFNSECQVEILDLFYLTEVLYFLHLRGSYLKQKDWIILSWRL